MKKEESTRTIPPVFPTDYQIIEVRNADGSVSYRHPNATGGNVEVNNQDLEDRLNEVMENFENLAAIALDYDEPGIGFIYRALAEHTKYQLHEIFHFLGNTIGRIECTTIDRRQGMYRYGRCIGVTLKPAKEETHGN